MRRNGSYQYDYETHSMTSSTIKRAATFGHAERSSESKPAVVYTSQDVRSVVPPDTRYTPQDARYIPQDSRFSSQDARYSSQDIRYSSQDARISAAASPGGRNRSYTYSSASNPTHLPTQDARFLPVPAIPCRSSSRV